MYLTVFNLFFYEKRLGHKPDFISAAKTSFSIPMKINNNTIEIHKSLITGPRYSSSLHKFRFLDTCGTTSECLEVTLFFIIF